MVYIINIRIWFYAFSWHFLIVLSYELERVNVNQTCFYSTYKLCVVRFFFLFLGLNCKSRCINDIRRKHFFLVCLLEKCLTESNFAIQITFWPYAVLHAYVIVWWCYVITQTVEHVYLDFLLLVIDTVFCNRVTWRYVRQSDS